MSQPRTVHSPGAMLTIGMAAQIATTIAANTVVFLIPHFHLERGLSLVEAGLLASCPLVGTMLTLVAWGWVVDHVGERISLAAGLGISTAGTAGAALFSDSYVGLGAFWFLAGLGSASSNVASGRLVVGWFAEERRGLAMGFRQMALPIGIGLAALIAPNLVEHIGLTRTLTAISVGCALVTAVAAVWVVDPHRPKRADAEPDQLANPYRGNFTLVRMHAASALLVIPQLTIWTFMLVWLIDDKGWSTFAASMLAAASQLLGALARIAAGWWSDHAQSRLAPMRLVAIAAFVVMLAFGVFEDTPLGVALLLLASAVTVADNGLAFTAVAEKGGPFWAGRALGVQNTGQYVFAMVVPPVIGALITATDYGIAFVVVAFAAALALPLIPREERRVR